VACHRHGFVALLAFATSGWEPTPAVWKVGGVWGWLFPWALLLAYLTFGKTQSHLSTVAHNLWL
jgi:hypothetical protein